MDKVAEQQKEYNSFKTLWIWQVRTEKTTKCAKKVFTTSWVSKMLPLLQLFRLLLGQEGKASPNWSNRKSSGSVKAFGERQSVRSQAVVLYCTVLFTVENYPVLIWTWQPHPETLSANKMSLEGWNKWETKFFTACRDKRFPGIAEC